MSDVRQAMILAAGLGERMRPLTLTTPKPLIEVAGKPIIAHGFEKLRAHGVSRVVVNCHWLADQVEAWARAQQGAQMILSDERAQLLDTGGGVKQALAHFGDAPFFVLNGDSFWTDGSEPTLARMQQAFRPDMDALLLLSTANRATGYDGRGDFFMDEKGVLTRRGERKVAPFIFTGVYLLHPRALAGMPDGPFSMNRVFDRALEQGRIGGLRHDGLWLHVGTPAAITLAEQALAVT